MAIDFTTDLGKVRLLISDVQDPPNQQFSDDEINAFLDLESGEVTLAAALAFETLAANEALVFKRIRALRILEADGPAVAEALTTLAQEMRDRADDDGSFAIADNPLPVITCWPN